jgi:dTDP-4-amino-4,6-dideoxygalactose transaminase
VLNHPNISPWPYYEADEIEAATQTLRSGKVNYWTGELGRQFEVAYAKHVGKQYGIALSNGTVALELALRVLGVKAGDEVIVASRSYVASASCVLLVGATPVFADVDVESGNISAQTIAPLITKKTKAVIPVHVAGWPCDMPAIMALANKHNLMVIEDCAQAHGAYVAGKPVGAWGHGAIFSFCQDKIISTGGEGGMLFLDDETAYKQAWAYKDIGRSYDAVYNQQHSAGFRWLTESAGSNFRMTEFQAAIGLKQLEKLPDWVVRRNINAEAIISTLKNFDFIEIPKLEKTSDTRHAYYRLYAKVKAGIIIAGLSGEALRNNVISDLEGIGVPCFFGSCSEIYREKLFANFWDKSKARLPNASNWADNGFCFLVHHTITTEQLAQMVINIETVMLNLRKKYIYEIL